MIITKTTTTTTKIRITNVGEDVEKLEPYGQLIFDGKRQPLCTLGERVKWYSHYKDSITSLKKLRTELPHDPVSPLPGVYVK